MGQHRSKRDVRLPLNLYRRTRLGLASGQSVQELILDAVSAYLDERDVPGVEVLPENSYFSDRLGRILDVDDPDWNEHEAVAAGAVPGRKPRIRRKLPPPSGVRPPRSSRTQDRWAQIKRADADVQDVPDAEVTAVTETPEPGVTAPGPATVGAGPEGERI